MSNKFGIILDMLKESFQNPVSVNDCCMIVDCMREYAKTRPEITSSDEERELARIGYPLTYHPCDHMERVRFAMHFRDEDNERVQGMLQKFKDL
jgi:hypothetical protein